MPEQHHTKILIIGAEKLFIDRVRELLPEDDDFKYELAASGFLGRFVELLVVDGLSWAGAAGFGLVVVALAAAHRLTFVVAALTFAAVVAIALIAFRADRWRLVRSYQALINRRNE